MKRRGRPSQVNVKKLAEYFRNNYSGMIYNEIKNLTSGTDVITKAALYLFTKNDESSCYRIVQTIRRNIDKSILVRKPEESYLFFNSMCTDSSRM